MWPLIRSQWRSRHFRRRRKLSQPSSFCYRRWIKLFAFALSCALFFQACGGSSELSAPDSAGDRIVGTEAVKTEAGSRQDANEIEAIAQEHDGDKPTPTPAAIAPPAVPVTAETLTYATIDGEAITGYFAQPEAAESNLPAIIAIHEWWGLNENIEAMARRIAGEGYSVLAVDLYNDQIATDPAAARELLRSVMDNPGLAQDNLSQAAQFLKQTHGASKLGVVGWCFGGNWSLRAGLLLRDLDAVVIYYGQLILAPEALDGLEAPVLGFFGEADSSIPVEDVENFEEILSGLDKPVEINLYPDAGHAFANPSGQNYDDAAAEDAWKKMTTFLEAQLT